MCVVAESEQNHKRDHSRESDGWYSLLAQRPIEIVSNKTQSRPPLSKDLETAKL